MEVAKGNFNGLEFTFASKCPTEIVTAHNYRPGFTLYIQFETSFTLQT